MQRPRDKSGVKLEHSMRQLGIFAILGAWTLAAYGVRPEPTFTATQLRSDLKEIDHALHDMPADLSHSVDTRDLDRAIRDLDSKLEKSPPLTRDEAWRIFATLNPLLADGHLFIGFVDWRGDVRAHLASGGTLFPFEVDVTPGCVLTVHQDPHSSTLPPYAYARIRAVNGAAVDEICEQMMARVHGDTRVFRADLLSRRFWFFYWKVFGAPDIYVIALDSNRTMRFDGGQQTFPGSTGQPVLLEGEQEFRRQFDMEFVADDPSRKSAGTAILHLRTFAWPNKDEVLAFTKQAFESLQRWHIKTLIIDLADNGGGNDDQWIEGVMPYLATQRWRTASAYRKRVVSPDPAKGEKVGDVVDGAMETWYEPQPDNPLHFGGKVYVAVGPGTYSSAVVMSTVVQDFGFGKVIGTGDSVRANQSGGTRRTTLTNTGLIVVTPRFVLRRPSGKLEPLYLTPDINWPPGQSLIDFPSTQLK
jgi:hypothetical protein